jgi:hypothetical protein
MASSLQQYPIRKLTKRQRGRQDSDKIKITYLDLHSGADLRIAVPGA